MGSLEDLRNPGERPGTFAMLIYLMLGPMLWGLHLTLIYGANTLICALGGGAAASRATVITATVLIAVPLSLVLLIQRRAGRLFGIADGRAGQRTYDAISRLTGLLSLAGILWAGTAAAILSACVQGR
ncbi:hypothetical protein NYR54_05980 [Chelativorans sp. SCAU2101]|jgi:hypothetical protein|uniref:Uncharacterized protein n=1 Tax=Chelativorans petroleitrophicus TaxID=2975484 RepID=A0A9X3B667_9HYPH|nr:hypothetical protein [Chelativorans petroleitrophicus]MCT8989842.1 hypothetical protein [Chelativorans petroleitrophicus]